MGDGKVSEPLSKLRELDMRVAQEVLGWEWRRNHTADVRAPRKVARRLHSPGSWAFNNLVPADGSEPMGAGWHYSIAKYTVDLNAAFKVARKTGLFSDYALTFCDEDNLWMVGVPFAEGPETMCVEYDDLTVGDTPALAICLAALRMVND